MMDSLLVIADAQQPWFTNAGTVGGLLGAAVGVLGGGIYGPLVGVCARQGKARSLVLGYHWFLIVLGLVLLGIGVTALASGQPYAVWYALLFPGALITFLIGMFTPMVYRAYREAEQRKLQAESFRRA